MSGSARGVRSNVHSYRNWGEGRSNAPSYPAGAPTIASRSAPAFSTGCGAVATYDGIVDP